MNLSDNLCGLFHLKVKVVSTLVSLRTRLQNCGFYLRIYTRGGMTANSPSAQPLIPSQMPLVGWQHVLILLHYEQRSHFTNAERSVHTVALLSYPFANEFLWASFANSQERSDALTVLAVAFYEFVAYVALNYYLIDPAESDLLIKLFQIFKWTDCELPHETQHVSVVYSHIHVR